MSEYIDKSEAVGEGYLQDWYISSVSEDDEPVWTEAHIEELANDFIVIPKIRLPLTLHQWCMASGLTLMVITLLRRAVSVKRHTRSQPRRKQKRAYGTRLCVLTATVQTAALRWTPNTK